MGIKAQASALALAATLGAGAATVLSKSDAKPVYKVHAMDLRTKQLDDGGFWVSTEAWAKRIFPDGGKKDLGKGFPCKMGPKEQAEQREHFQAAEICISE